MKKIIVILILLLVAGGVLYFFFWAPSYKVKAFNVVPADAVFIIASSKPVESWKSLSGSEMWQHLKQNPSFGKITRDIDAVDSLIRANRWLDLIGNNEVLISAHKTRLKYDYLFYLDIGKASQLNTFKHYLQNVVGDKVNVTYRTVEGEEITELYFTNLKKTLHMVFLDNMLVASFVSSLVDEAIAQFNTPKTTDAFTEITDHVGYTGLLRVYLNYGQFTDYLGQYTADKNTFQVLRNSLLYSGFALDYDDNVLSFSGFTNLQDTVSSYFKALHQSGVGEHDFLEIIPVNTPYFMAMGFDDLTTFVANFEKAMDTEQKEDYLSSREKIESFLKIDLQKDFIDWVDDEIVLIQNSPMKGNLREFALILKTKNTDQANQGLNKIREQIKKKTPVKIKSISYLGHDIHYFAMKGFFKPVLGKLFDKFDKPYYTIIDDWVIFSNHPRTLKNIIESVKNRNTLGNEPQFLEYYDKLESGTALFAYVNLPMLFPELRHLADKNKVLGIERNKEYIVCFDQISFQLSKSRNHFHSGLHVLFKEPRTVEPTKESNNKNEQDLEQVEWEDVYMLELDNLDKIVIPDLNNDEFQMKYDNGQVQYSIQMKDGWKHGRFESYFENGERQFRGKYKEDKKDGTWRVYNEEGDLITKLRYDEGELLVD